ncbi:MAG: tetratricopeptide repeat protein [Treponema sp.]|nr:tetratricopeptide repeat protein [Treponema sp.]
MHRKQTIHAVTAVVLIGILISSGMIVFIGWRNRLGNERKDLTRLWEEGSFEEVFEISMARLETKPMDYFLLTLHGFSAYQLAVAQINSYDTQTYIDACIWSLRKALLCKEGPGDLRVHYVLGKAYYYKGAAYADMAVTFLEAARTGNYPAGDLPEYLGLAYAAIQDYRNSVAAFSLALDPGVEDRAESGEVTQNRAPSDLLLLSIARSYLALEEADTARAYLIRCVETSRDSNILVAARLLLGEIYGKSGDVSGAEAQYLAILEEGGENAEAHFQLGELYAGGGDSTRARAEWRRAVRIDPTHGPARTRLNM